MTDEHDDRMTVAVKVNLQLCKVSMNNMTGSPNSFAQGTLFLSASNHSTVNFYVSNTKGESVTHICKMQRMIILQILHMCK